MNINTKTVLLTTNVANKFKGEIRKVYAIEIIIEIINQERIWINCRLSITSFFNFSFLDRNSKYFKSKNTNNDVNIITRDILEGIPNRNNSNQIIVGIDIIDPNNRKLFPTITTLMYFLSK